MKLVYSKEQHEQSIRALEQALNETESPELKEDKTEDVLQWSEDTFRMLLGKTTDDAKYLLFGWKEWKPE